MTWVNLVLGVVAPLLNVARTFSANHNGNKFIVQTYLCMREMCNDCFMVRFVQAHTALCHSRTKKLNDIVILFGFYWRTNFKKKE